jgi:uncharacterized membrane protein (UPF0127 family)
MKITNTGKNIVLADQARIADTFLTRLVGLLGRKALARGEALVLIPSNSIHSFFMRFCFDAIFLDQEKKVVGLLSGFKPFRISKIYFKACMTIELPYGTILASQTQPGDLIEII